MHPSFDIIRKLVDTPFLNPESDALDAYTELVWPMPVWVGGTQRAVGGGQTQTDLTLIRDDENALLGLQVYISEAEAEAAQGGGAYFASRFPVPILLAEGQRMEVLLIEGDECLQISHKQLMVLRDLVSMSDDGAYTKEEECKALLQAIGAFPVRAKQYCKTHPEIDSLHLATLFKTGIKPMLVGILQAANYEQHARALDSISEEEFIPGWRFALIDEQVHHRAMLSDLQQATPCYLKEAEQGFWNRLTGGAKATQVPMITYRE